MIAAHQRPASSAEPGPTAGLPPSPGPTASLPHGADLAMTNLVMAKSNDLRKHTPNLNPNDGQHFATVRVSNVPGYSEPYPNGYPMTHPNGGPKG